MFFAPKDASSALLVVFAATTAVSSSPLPADASVSLDVSAALSPVVDLGYAKFVGSQNTSTGLTTYTGVKYAAPPVGKLRWNPPCAIEEYMRQNGTYGATLDATKPGLKCFSGNPGWTAALADIGDTGVPTSTVGYGEDCLWLDVTVPNKPRSTALPVAVSIHGGGYVGGSNSPGYATEFMKDADGSLIVIQIQYRLGAYGFLAGPEISKDGGTQNAGLLDQRSALEWVQRNVAKFGGDPKKVTIWGGSAGGGSVFAQMSLYGGQKTVPFRAGIAEYPGVLPMRSKDVTDAQYSDLLSAAGCKNMACLRALPEIKLYNATMDSYAISYKKGLYGYGDFWYTPTKDGTIIKDYFSQSFAKGAFTSVPLITTRQTYEGLGFTNFSVNTAADVKYNLQQLFRTTDSKFIDQVLATYPIAQYTSWLTDPAFAIFQIIVPSIKTSTFFYQSLDIWSNFAIICQSFYGAQGNAKKGGATWKLYFDAGDKTHGSSGPFIVGSNTASGNAPLAIAFKDYFRSFIVNLDPNMGVSNTPTSARKITWPQYTSSKTVPYTILRLNDTQSAVIADPATNNKCDVFSQNIAITKAR